MMLNVILQDDGSHEPPHFYKLELRPSDKLVYLLGKDSLVLNGDGYGTTDWRNPDSNNIAQYWQMPPD